MDWIFLVAAVVTATTLVISGSLKLGHVEGTLRGIRELTLPAALDRRTLAHALPIVELVIGVGMLLVPAPVYVVLATGAVLLCAGFLLVIARSLREAPGAQCACFGGLSTKPVSRKTLARNAFLVVTALLALPLGGVSNVLEGRWVLALALVVLATVVVARILSEQRLTQEGDQVSRLQLFDAQGNGMALAEFQQPPTVLVFFSFSCASCWEMVPYFRSWPESLPEGLDLQPVLAGPSETFAKVEAFAPLVEHAWYDPDGSVAASLEILTYPAAVLISADGSSAPAIGQGEITRLLRQHGAKVNA